jgi:putative ABC transport system permease protein
VLPIAYRERIRNVPGVKEVMAMQWYGGTYKDNRDVRNMFARFSVEPDKLFTIYPEYQMPEDQKEAFRKDRRSCIVGRPVAERLGLKIGDRVYVQGDIFPVDLDLTIRGIYDARRDNENLMFHHDYLAEGAPAYKNIVMLFAVRVDKAENVRAVIDGIDQQFRNSTAETKTDTERAFEISFLSYLGDVKSFLFAVAGSLTFMILLVAANTMAMSARERVREIGVLRTLGFTPGEIFGLLIGEAAFLGVAGGLLGVGLAELICAGLRTLPTVFVDLRMLGMTAALALLCTGTAVMIAAMSCAIPAWGASRRGITEALRFVD